MIISWLSRQEVVRTVFLQPNDWLQFQLHHRIYSGRLETFRYFNLNLDVFLNLTGASAQRGDEREIENST